MWRNHLGDFMTDETDNDIGNDDPDHLDAELSTLDDDSDNLDSDSDSGESNSEGLEEDNTQPVEKKTSRAQREIIALRERAQKAEAELSTARQVKEQPAQIRDAVWEQEEAVLKNPDADDWKKYAVQSARAARVAEQNSRNAIQRAEDLADKTAFALVKTERPGVYAKYSPLVEKKLEEIRRGGGNAPREAILALLLGQDMLSRKVTPSSPKTKPGNVRRSPTGARSDIPKGGVMNESEKRAKRLENIRI